MTTSNKIFTLLTPAAKFAEHWYVNSFCRKGSISSSIAMILSLKKSLIMHDCLLLISGSLLGFSPASLFRSLMVFREVLVCKER